jgi:uncharacterized membrane protein
VARAFRLGQWLLAVGMLVAAAAAWPSAPAQVPIHWGLDGQPTDYADRTIGLFLLPLTAVLLAALFVVLPRLDPEPARTAAFERAFAVMGFAVIAVLAVVQVVVQLWTAGVQVSVGPVVSLAVGGLFVVIGALLGQVPRNWFVGIRTPWTLTSDRAWGATHRAGRWVFVLMGVGLVIPAVIQTPSAFALAIGGMVVGVLGLVAYSYVVWRTDPDRRAG